MKLIRSETEFQLSPTLASNEMVKKRRASGEEVLHMGFGESPFPAAKRLEEALVNNVHFTNYTPTGGIAELQKTVLEYYADKTGLNPDDYDVVVAPGSKLILYSVQMAVEGDLIMPVPSWVSYEPQAKLLQQNTIYVPTELNDTGYSINVEELAAIVTQARSDGKNPSKLILNYPNNPTGLSIPKDNLKAIAEYCKSEDILIISDEIYGFVAFDKEYRSAREFAPDHTVISTGLSKHLSLGGWRLGIGLIPKSIKGLGQLLRDIASETWSCVPTPIQMAAIEAYKNHADIEKHIEDCTAIHNLMNNFVATNLRNAGVQIAMPQGAFYTYPNFAPLIEQLGAAGIHTAKDLSDYLLEHYGLATLPGHAFGEEEHTLTLRLAACDFDGETVLKAYQEGQELDDNFIQENAANVAKAVKAFEKFIADTADILKKKRA